MVICMSKELLNRHENDLVQHLAELEHKSILIIREAFKQTRNLYVLWSMGKDSTVLVHLIRKAFLGNFPISLVHIDTSFKIPEMITFRDEYVKKHNLNLIIGKNQDALNNGMNHTLGKLNCCGALKTQALLDIILSYNIHGLMLGIRRDEEGSRGKERVVSPRFNSGKDWQYKDQLAEIADYYNFHLPEDIHLRIHPILHWTELDIWEYIKQENLEILPLYYAKNGIRYRSLGCYPCTNSIVSQATTLDEIILELKNTKESERAGRAQDQADNHAMQLLRKIGYM